MGVRFRRNFINQHNHSVQPQCWLIIIRVRERRQLRHLHLPVFPTNLRVIQHIVDTPPSLNILTDNVHVATGNVVIPVIPKKLNVNSLQISQSS